MTTWRMTQRLRRVLAGTLIVLAGGMGLAWCDQQQDEQRVKEMADSIMQQKITQCVGRFLIDLPKNARIKYWTQEYEAAGTIYVTPNVTRSQYEKNISDRIHQLNTAPHSEAGVMLVGERPLKLETGHLVYFWDSSLIKTRRYKVEAFYWKNGVQYKLENDISAQYIDNADPAFIRFFSSLRTRQPDEIPYEPGFCFDHSFFPGNKRDTWEHVEVHIDFADKQDVQLRLSTLTTSKIEEKTLLERDADNELRREYASHFTTLRSRDRSVGPIKGQELAFRGKENNGTSRHALTWEAFFTPNDVYAPAINFEMKTGWQPSFVPANSSLTDDEALAIWDAILSTLRLRPESPPPQSSRGDEPTLIRPAIPLGMRLPSGAYCPQAGTWVCESPEPRVQFFAKGDLLPPVRTEDRKWLRTQVKDHAVIWTLRQYAEESGNG